MTYIILACLYTLVLCGSIVGGHAITDKLIHTLGPSIKSILLGLFLSLAFGYLLGYTFVTISLAVLP